MLKVKNLKKKFDDVNVLKGISFDVNDRDIVAIVGPSGSGKSTLLRCLNLIEVPTSGDIVFEGKSLLDKKTNLSQVRAKMGMVFQ
ncbi:amino acid ABC transporter ATP-binding protein [Clostridium sp. CAG:609]|nr:amino acid ABC transporter ATP-binding protein [Clostridium sp. CAG:609]